MPEIDPTIRLAMDQQFSNNHNALQHLGTAAVQQAQFVNQAVQLQHVRNAGAFDAKALQNLEEEGIADAVLQNRAAAGQPGNAPDGSK